MSYPYLIKSKVQALLKPKPHPLIEKVKMTVQDKMLEHFADEIAAIAHKHLSFLACELIPMIPDVLTRTELSQIYGTPYACLDEAQRIRARNMAYDLMKLLTSIGRP